MYPLKIIKPYIAIHLGRIVFYQIELRPTHGLIEPFGVVRGQRRCPSGARAAKAEARPLSQKTVCDLPYLSFKVRLPVVRTGTAAQTE